MLCTVTELNYFQIKDFIKTAFNFFFKSCFTVFFYWRGCDKFIRLVHLIVQKAYMDSFPNFVSQLILHFFAKRLTVTCMFALAVLHHYHLVKPIHFASPSTTACLKCDTKGMHFFLVWFLFFNLLNFLFSEFTFFGSLADVIGLFFMTLVDSNKTYTNNKVPKIKIDEITSQQIYWKYKNIKVYVT